MKTTRKMTLGVCCVLVLVLSGCKEETKREALGPGVLETGERSCTKADMCYRCGIGFDGKFSCGFGFSVLCPGKQTATVRYTKMRISYDDGSFEEYTASETVAASNCK